MYKAEVVVEAPTLIGTVCSGILNAHFLLKHHFALLVAVAAALTCAAASTAMLGWGQPPHMEAQFKADRGKIE